jgi:hypothetical protein
MKEISISLYRNILKLHRLLPEDLKALGNSYVRNEFRLHRGGQVTDVQETIFLREWSQYYEQLLKQVAHDFTNTKPEQTFPLGKKIEQAKLAQMNDDQLFTLMELRKHASGAESEESNTFETKK